MTPKAMVLSEAIAVVILLDEAEAYLSAVGDADDSADKIRWAVRQAKELVEREYPQALARMVDRP